MKAHSFLVTGYLTRDTRNVTGYFSGISSVTGYSVTGYFSGNGEIMGIALRPPVGEISINPSKTLYISLISSAFGRQESQKKSACGELK